LYDLTNDPFEMNNLLSSPVTEEILVRMRSLYDKEIQKWQQSAVPYNDYTCFGTIFDRAASWPEKKAVIPKSFYDFYEKDLQDAGIAAPPYDYKRVLAEVESKYR